MKSSLLVIVGMMTLSGCVVRSRSYVETRRPEVVVVRPAPVHHHHDRRPAPVAHRHGPGCGHIFQGGLWVSVGAGVGVGR